MENEKWNFFQKKTYLQQLTPNFVKSLFCHKNDTNLPIDPFARRVLYQKLQSQ